MRPRTVSLLLTPLLSFSLIHGVSAQKKTDRELDGLKGSVRAVRIEIADLDKDGNHDKNGRWLSRLTSYDEAGHKTADETFYAFGRLSYGKDTYSYDSTGNLAEQTHEINGTLRKTTYTYNDEGQLVAETTQPGGNRRTYNYDKKGRRTELLDSFVDGTRSGRRVFQYDDLGRVIATLTYGRDGSFEGRAQLRTYDEKGRLASEANSEDKKYRYYSKDVYAYDDGDNKTLQERYDNKGLTDRTFYNYEFDSVGNWTKQVAVRWNNRDGGWTDETYRIITYDDSEGRSLLNLILNEYNPKSQTKKF